MVYLLSLYWDLERSGSRVNLKMYLNHLHRHLEWETTVCLRYFYEEKNLAQQYCKYNDDISLKTETNRDEIQCRIRRKYFNSEHSYHEGLLLCIFTLK